MNKAHVFQHNYTGVQMFIYHCVDEVSAKYKLWSVVVDKDKWTYLGQKIAQDI